MLRESSWEIIWDAAGDSPAVLLTHEDLMDAEIRLPTTQLTGVGKPDFSPTGLPKGFGNKKRRLEFSRRIPQPSAAAAFQAALDGVRLAPWGIKAVLTIQPRGGAVRSYTAALLSCAHRPDNLDGICEVLQNWSFRVSPVSVSGDGVGPT